MFHDSTTHGFDSLIEVDDGYVKAQMPLATFGEGHHYPGIFYNQQGVQFSDLVAKAAGGDEEASNTLSPVVLASLVLVGGTLLILAVSGSGGGSDDDSNGGQTGDPGVGQEETPTEEQPGGESDPGTTEESPGGQDGTGAPSEEVVETAEATGE